MTEPLYDILAWVVVAFFTGLLLGLVIGGWCKKTSDKLSDNQPYSEIEKNH